MTNSANAIKYKNQKFFQIAIRAANYFINEILKKSTKI